ncbi:hypothetical protein, partial [Ruegeria denitrificans]|uniref:hypothetical protein n=1 Tax=Ruegeria denitrificans TaxID=1715692 RepID=UPI001A943C3B
KDREYHQKTLAMQEPPTEVTQHWCQMLRLQPALQSFAAIVKVHQYWGSLICPNFKSSTKTPHPRFWRLRHIR